MKIDLVPAFRTACAGGIGYIAGKSSEMGSSQAALAFAVAQVACEAFLYLSEDEDEIKLPKWLYLSGIFAVPAIGSALSIGALYLSPAKLTATLAQAALWTLGASLTSAVSLFVTRVKDLNMELKLSQG